MPKIKKNQAKTGKHPGGRPPIYKTPNEMQAAIERYYTECTKDEKPKTFAGLSIALGFYSRKTLYNYEGKQEFLHVIKKAKAIIEAEVESRLFGANATGSIFWLKNNAEYKDRTEHEHSGTLTIEDKLAEIHNGHP